MKHYLAISCALLLSLTCAFPAAAAEGGVVYDENGEYEYSWGSDDDGSWYYSDDEVYVDSSGLYIDDTGVYQYDSGYRYTSAPSITSISMSGYKVKWTVSGSASKYQIRLYYNGSVVATKTTTSKSINLGKYFKWDGYYDVSVRAYHTSTGWSSWYDSDDYYRHAYSSGNSNNNTANATASQSGPGAFPDGSWQQTGGRWWYRYSDGSYPKACWVWIDGNKDGIAECYYFWADGYLAQNCVVDGYNVDSDGRWVVNGIVQTKR